MAKADSLDVIFRNGCNKMTITDIARMMINADQYQRGVTQPKYPNGAAISYPNAPDDGLDITGMTAEDRKVVPVSKEAEQAV